MPEVDQPDNENREKTINTGGGASILGNVDVGRDFVGRDQIIINIYRDIGNSSKINDSKVDGDIFRCAKMSKDISPKDVLGLRIKQYHPFYYLRDFDIRMHDDVLHGNSFVIIGDPLSGKTRSVYELIKKLDDYMILIVGNHVASIENLHIPSSNKVIAFFDDIYHISDDNRALEKLFFELLAMNVIIIATCFSGEEYKTGFENRLSEKVREHFKTFEIPKLTEEDIRDIGDEIWVQDTENFDGNIGSLFLELSKMKDRFRRLMNSENAIDRTCLLILKSLTALNISSQHIYQRGYFALSVYDFCEKKYSLTLKKSTQILSRSRH